MCSLISRWWVKDCVFCGGDAELGEDGQIVAAWGGVRYDSEHGSGHSPDIVAESGRIPKRTFAMRIGNVGENGVGKR